MANKESTDQSYTYCIELLPNGTRCNVRIPIYEIMCKDCRKRLPEKAALLRTCGECGRQYFVKETKV